MKIYTESITFEMTMEEFENILANNWLPIMIDTIATLSTRVEMEQAKQTTAILNEILGGGLEEEYYDDIEEEDDYLEESCDATINRIYNNIFGRGDM